MSDPSLMAAFPPLVLQLVDTLATKRKSDSTLEKLNYNILPHGKNYIVDTTVAPDKGPNPTMHGIDTLQRSVCVVIDPQKGTMQLAELVRPVRVAFSTNIGTPPDIIVQPLADTLRQEVDFKPESATDRLLRAMGVKKPLPEYGYKDPADVTARLITIAKENFYVPDSSTTPLPASGLKIKYTRPGF